MEDEERREHAEMLSGDMLNAVFDLECLWHCHGLPGVPTELYGSRKPADYGLMRIIAQHMETGDLVSLLREFVETLYGRFNMDPETRREGDDKERV